MCSQSAILVVDDEPDNFDVIETLLHRSGYQLNYASSGVRAIERLQTFQPDLILLDVMMPDANGMEVCRQIKAQRRWQMIPIIMVTALTAKEDLAQCLAAGADDFISKPINGIELRARIHSMLRIKQQYDDLQSLIQLREDMVSMIVHDLRNPLASILLATDILRLPGASLTGKEARVDQIAIAGQQMQAMIDSLLMLAKLESGKMMLNCIEIDLCAVCTSAASDLEAIAAQRNLKIVTQLPAPGGSICVDATVFRRVLDNLLSNAIKFSPKNSQILLEADYAETGGAIIRVADSGPGVSATYRQHIFEKFEIGTLVKDTTQIGLGLAFCKMAIEAHGGQIAIEDNQPRGTVFRVLLPSSVLP